MNIFDLNLNIIILILRIQAFIFLRVVIELGLNNKVFKAVFHCHTFTIIFLLIINCVYYLIYNGEYKDLGITVTDNILLSILLLVIITIFVLNNNLDSIKKPKNKIVDESINNEE